MINQQPRINMIHKNQQAQSYIDASAETSAKGQLRNEN